MKDKDSDVRKRKHLTPEEKYQIFIEATMAKAQGNGRILVLIGFPLASTS